MFIDEISFDLPTGLATDSLDNLYVVDSGTHRVLKFNPVRPIYVAVDSQGNVFVTDDRNPVAQKFDNEGHFLTKWGSLGTGDGQFNHAHPQSG